MVTDRLRDFTKKLKDTNLDAAIFYKTDNIDEKSIYYLLGLKFNPAILFVFPKRKPVLFVSPLDKLGKSELKKLDGITVKILDGKLNIYSVLKSEKRIGVSEFIIPKKFHSVIFSSIKKEKKYTPKLVNCDIVSKMRLVKYYDEVEIIKKAVSITEQIFLKMFSKFKSQDFVCEDEVVKFLRVETIEAGCELAFDPIVASGKNSANPHYFPMPDTKLKKGFCVVDFGVKLKGYCADITRTIYLGSPSDAELSKYSEVNEALSYCESTLCEGMKMDKYLLEFQKKNFSLIHALGHGIGLDIHEFPSIAKSNNITQINNVVAVEPGYYLKNKFGIRIEDDFILTKAGLKCLCKLSRELECFDL